jgi:hypothetical protein
MLRFFFALPDPLPFPDGWHVTERVADRPDAHHDDDPIVTVIFRQVASEYGRTRGAMQAVLDVAAGSAGIPAPARAEFSAEDNVPRTSYTVVEAVTAADSPDHPPDDWAGLGSDLPARTDPLIRCLRLVSDLARAYRITCKVPYGVPSYERLVQPILVYSAHASREWLETTPGSGGTSQEYQHSTGEWTGPSVVILDHLNTADIVAGPEIDRDGMGQFAHWMHQIRLGAPLVSWRERLVEADRALHIHGEYAQAVSLTQTACEVLLDTLLLLLLWEEQAPAETAADLLEEGRLARRIKSEWQPRLGGNWQLTGNGAVAQWFQHAAQLRNRVVHGGYMPARSQAETAYQSAFPLEKFVFNRLAERRNQYPRATLMTIARSGLERRGYWSGKIKRFAEQTAPGEPDWQESFVRYRAAVSRART